MIAEALQDDSGGFQGFRKILGTFLGGSMGDFKGILDDLRSISGCLKGVSGV